MSTRAMLCAMVAGTALVMLAAGRPAAKHEPPAKPRPPEAPWLTPEAAAQIVGSNGRLGPLFSGLELGGPAPSSADRARIAAFARANRVAIDLDVADGELAAIRFAVTFGGCCGYEGADVLALRMGRPETSRCCGCVAAWIDDWAITGDDGLHMRAQVRVNRVEARWERSLSLPELLDRAEGLLGTSTHVARSTAGDRWTELEHGHRYLFELPYPFAEMPGFSRPLGIESRNDLGLELRADAGRIHEVAFSLRELNYNAERLTAATLHSRWGRPRVSDSTWTWRLSDRIVTAELSTWPPRITIRKR